VGNHWQNGVIDHHVGIIVNTAQTILLPTMAKWPSVINKKFWPFTVCHTDTFHGTSVHTDTSKSPHHMLTEEEALL
jgi:hypothetical protein